jgi:hypothetical protein
MAASLELGKRLAAQSPDAARAVFDALEEPFAVHLLDRQRLLLRVELADTLHDGERCRRALAPFTKTPLWQEDLLAARERCYVLAAPGSAMARQAAADLRDFEAAEPRPLEEDR